MLQQGLEDSDAASGKFAIRKGDWVLIAAPTGDDNGRLGEPDWFEKDRGYTSHDQPGELFDLRRDLAERRNAYANHPEVVAELTAQLRQYINDGRSTPGPKQANDVPVIFDKPKEMKP